MTASDISGNAYIATLYGPYWVGGKINSALAFDGVNDYADLNYAVPANNFTISAWVKAEESHEIDIESGSGTLGVSGQKYLFGSVHGGASNAGANVSVGTNGISVYGWGSGYMPALAVYSGNWEPVGIILLLHLQISSLGFI